MSQLRPFLFFGLFKYSFKIFIRTSFTQAIATSNSVWNASRPRSRTSAFEGWSGSCWRFVLLTFSTFFFFVANHISVLLKSYFTRVVVTRKLLVLRLGISNLYIRNIVVIVLSMLKTNKLQKRLHIIIVQLRHIHTSADSAVDNCVYAKR